MKNLILFSILILLTLEERKINLIYEHFRHGARFPESNLNSKNNDLFNIHHDLIGEITEVGLRMHYIEGYEIREKYLNIYNSTNIYVQSTNSERTIQSANAHLLGMYPSILKNLSDEQVKNSYPPNKFDDDIKEEMNELIKKLENRPLPYNMQIIPVHILSPLKQKYSSTFCPYMKYFWNENKKKYKKNFDNIYKETEEKYGKYFKKFFNNDSFTFENFDVLESYCDHYISDYLFNINYFDKLYITGISLQEFYNQCKKINELKIFKNYFTEDKYIIYGNSPLIRDMISFFNNKDKNNSPKYKILSGHDSTVGSLQSYFKYVFKNEITKNNIYPELATTMIIELYEENNKEYIEYKINDEILMNIEYEKFNEMIQKNLISDEELDNFCNTKNNTVLYYIFLVIFLLIIIILAYLIYKTYIDYKIEMSNSV